MSTPMAEAGTTGTLTILLVLVNTGVAAAVIFVAALEGSKAMTDLADLFLSILVGLVVMRGTTRVMVETLAVLNMGTSVGMEATDTAVGSSYELYILR